MSLISFRNWPWLQKTCVGHSARRTRRSSSSDHVAADVERLETRRLMTVTYHGGAVLASVEAQGVYLGSDWQTTSSLVTQKGQFDQFLSTIVSGKYMDTLSNAGYGVGRGTSSAGATDNTALNKTTGITDGWIQQEIQVMINANQLQKPDANRLYVVYVEPGVVIRLGADSSATSFLGYHGAFAGKTSTGAAVDIHYAVISYPGGVNPSYSSQGFTSNFNEQTAVTSHELAEAVTDPNVNYKALGWYDDQKNGEIGDLTRITVSFNGYVVQEVVNQNDQPMDPNGNTTVGLTAPQNVTVKALSSTTASLSWNAVTGTQGYRVFQVNGSQSVLVGTLSASTTSVQINGLTAGSTVSFKVEAYNGATVADSSVVSVTLTADRLGTPRLTATVLNSTSVQLNWTAATGTQGYRIYVSDGTRRYLLGTVTSGVTSVNVVGLARGTKYQFQVEAFQGTAIQDSNWATVTTSASRSNHFSVPTALTAEPVVFFVIGRRPGHN